ncbi:MAG: hypothetical protein HY271_02465 [Deltaproteobacteria bacterium]|nr:hypothetical protein [Deltaproteobacteria bacterium]
MRRIMGTAALAWFAGFCMAATVASGYTLLDAWRGFGENFQRGYIVGYLDAVSLQKRHDVRVWLPSSSHTDFERWRSLVNDYFADPANAKRSVPDGMAAAGKIIQHEVMDNYRKHMEGMAAPSPVASSAPDASPTSR